MKKHRALKIVLICILVLIIAVPTAGYLVFRTEIKAASSVKKLGQHLYTLTYEGDYGFNAFIENGGASSDSAMADYIIGFLTHGFWKESGAEEAENTIGCSALTVTSPDGDVLFGRNYDWADCDIMIVKTLPADGYASVSTCCLDFLGFGDGWTPEGTANQMMSLAAVYVPLDGMNEKGLCVADLMAGDKTETHQNTDKPDLTTVSAIRLLLDRAADVEQAIALLSQYDMNLSIGSAHHLAISDATGKSVTVEYIDNVMYVTETPVLTNHYMTQGAHLGIGSEQSHTRFDTLTDTYKSANGVMDKDALLSAMASVAQSNFQSDEGSYEGTQWTLVCDTKALTVDFYYCEQYQTPYVYRISTAE